MRSTSRPVAGKTTLTTGDVARICEVTPRTAAKWCDTGLLKHWKIPSSNERRIQREDLAAFLVEYDLPFRIP